MREEPYLKANLEIVEARALVGKDMSGSSDPFCTCYLTTNPISRFNTSYKVSYESHLLMFFLMDKLSARTFHRENDFSLFPSCCCSGYMLWGPCTWSNLKTMKLATPNS